MKAHAWSQGDIQGLELEELGFQFTSSKALLLFFLRSMALKKFFYFIVFTFTHMGVHYLGHLTHPTPPPLPGRTCSAFLFSDFVEEKT
jgi:hypothetical protein